MSPPRLGAIAIALVAVCLTVAPAWGAAEMVNCGGGVRAALVGCSKAKRIFLFVRRSGEHSDVSSERPAKLYSHVTESSESDHADLFVFTNVPVSHWRIGGDPCAKERRSSGHVEIRR